MPLGRRRSPPRVAVEPERGGISGFLRRWTIPIIGALTPAALIVVNISVFIAKNLSEFRVTITILAFVSGLMLNSWTALNIYRVLQQRRPDHAIVRERNQEVVLVIGMAVVIIAAALTALFCYLGLASYQDLPNGLTFFTGFFAAAIPIFLRAIFTRGTRKGRGKGGPPISTISGLPPTGTPSPPTSASMHQPIPRR
jgi:energy-converting hydrogenase Eha subunit A